MAVFVAIFIPGAACALLHAQSQPQYQAQPDPPSMPRASAPADPSPVPLDFVPPAMDNLGSQAVSKSSFSFDRSMLAAAVGLMGGSMDDATRHAVANLEGLSVRMLRFNPDAPADPAQVDAIRQAYHLRGWKHVITTTAPIRDPISGGPVQDGTTDVWIVIDGANIRGAVILVDSPQSLTLATIAGNLSPEDLLHLRGHFGIPKFEGNNFDGSGTQKGNGRQIQ